MVDVEVDYDNRVAVLKDETKQRAHLTVSKAPGGTIFFMVSTSQGKVPAALAGKFSSLEAGIKHVTQYLNNRAKSNGVKRKAYRDNLEERIQNASKSDTKGK